jgi:hypothetical protein
MLPGNLRTVQKLWQVVLKAGNTDFCSRNVKEDEKVLLVLDYYVGNSAGCNGRGREE